MITQRTARLILVFAMLFVPFLFAGCEWYCDCEDEIEATYGHFGEPDEIFAETTEEKFELTLRYVDLGFEKVFVWGDRESRYCCLESTKEITEDDSEDSEDDDNTAPEASDVTVEIDINGGDQEINLSADDADGDALTYQIQTEPVNGVLDKTQSDDAIFTYTPNTDVAAGDTDTFTYVANDGQVDSNEATVSITFVDSEDSEDPDDPDDPDNPDDPDGPGSE